MSGIIINSITILIIGIFIIFLVTNKKYKDLTSKHWYFFAISTIYWVSIKMIKGFNVVYAEDLGFTIAAVTAIAGAYGLISIFVRLPMGIVSDWTRNKMNVFRFGLLVLILANLVLLIAPTATILYFVSMATGIAASVWGLVNVIFTDMFKSVETYLAISILSLSPLIADFLAAPFQNYALGQDSYAMMYLFSTVFGIIALIMTFKYKEVIIPGEKIVISEIRNTIFDRKLLIISTMAMSVLFVKYAIAGGVATKYATDMGMSDTGLAYLSSSFAITQLISGFLVGTYMIKKIGVKFTLFIGLIITSVSAILSGIFINPKVFFILFGLHGLGFGITYNVLLGMAIDGVDERLKSTYMGVFQSIYAIGMWFGPTLSLLLAEKMEMSQVYIVVGIFTLILIIPTNIINWNKHRVNI